MAKGAINGMSSAVEQVTEGQFLQGAQSWTLGANWALDTDGNNGLVHTAGAIEGVTQDLANATHTTVTYQFNVWIEGRTAGTLTVESEAITANGQTVWTDVLDTDTTLNLVPDTNFDGKVVSVSVRELIPQP